MTPAANFAPAPRGEPFPLSPNDPAPRSGGQFSDPDFRRPGELLDLCAADAERVRLAGGPGVAVGRP